MKLQTPQSKTSPAQQKRKAERKVERKGEFDRKVERRVEFEEDAIRYCVQDMARHYRISTSLSPCEPDCKYVHYNKLPAKLSTAAVLSAIEKITTKLGLTENQMKQFDKSIRADKKFK